MRKNIIINQNHKNYTNTILFINFYSFLHFYVWLCGVVVRALDLQSTGRGFDSWPPRCRVATLGKLFTCAQHL